MCSYSRVAQWKRAGPITQRSEDRNLALLIIFLQFESTKMLNQSTAIYTLISLASSFVVQANSADLNQTPLLIRVTTVYFQNVLSEFGQSENRPLSQIYSCPMKTHHSSDVHSYVAYQTLCKIVLFIFIIYPGDKRPEFRIWGGASKSVFVLVLNSVNINLIARLSVVYIKYAPCIVTSTPESLINSLFY